MKLVIEIAENNSIRINGEIHTCDRINYDNNADNLNEQIFTALATHLGYEPIPFFESLINDLEGETE